MRKIIIRFPNWLGDLVMAQPVLAAVRKIYPEAEITVLVKKALKQVLKQDPDLDRLWSFEDSSHQKLKQEKFDLGILLTNSFSSAWHFFRGKVKNRLGYASDWRFWLLNLKVEFFKKQQHQSASYQKILSPLNFTVTFPRPKIYILEEEKEQALKILGLEKKQLKNKKIIAFSPFAAFGPAKCWPLQNYLDLMLKILLKRDAYIIFLGDKSFQGQMQIKQAFPEKIKKYMFDLVGKTSLRELMAILSLSDLMVTNDSGPMHLAAALEKPLIALFGSTSPVFTGPVYDPFAEIIYQKQDCSPCYQRTCSKDKFCMEEITVDKVAESVEKILAGANLETLYV